MNKAQRDQAVAMLEDFWIPLMVDKMADNLSGQDPTLELSADDTDYIKTLLTHSLCEVDYYDDPM